MTEFNRVAVSTVKGYDANVDVCLLFDSMRTHTFQKSSSHTAAIWAQVPPTFSKRGILLCSACAGKHMNYVPSYHLVLHLMVSGTTCVACSCLRPEPRGQFALLTLVAEHPPSPSPSLSHPKHDLCVPEGSAASADLHSRVQETLRAIAKIQRALDSGRDGSGRRTLALIRLEDHSGVGTAKSHRALGHAATSKFSKMLRLDGAPTAAVEHAKHRRCPVCIAAKLPQRSSRTTTTRTRPHTLNNMVCVDRSTVSRGVLERCTMCGQLGKKNMVPKHVVQAFVDMLFNHSGMPEIVGVDQEAKSNLLWPNNLTNLVIDIRVAGVTLDGNKEWRETVAA